MYISISWIKEFVDLSGIETEELIKKFNLTTAEIEGYEEKGKNTSGIIFARIEKVAKHPNSDHLHILTVNNGIENLQIVCGAPNVRENMTVCLAPIGSYVSGHKMGKAKLAGVESFGMCCSEEELGIGSDNTGIMDIDFPVTLGADIKTVFPIDDIVFEIDNKSLTNRPDLWGHYGIAREFAAMFNRELKPLNLVNLNDFSNNKPLEVVVNSKDCYRYSSIAVENITQKVSPQTMKIRLMYCGMRDINLLTDLTNYIMLELGQPMHAFDKNIVKGIHVNSAKKGIKLLTLEGEEHEIPQDAPLICDNNDTPVAIAGIKGGKLSGITNNTTSLLLESANFDSKAIRVASTAIGLKTDASLRYEKSLDPEITTIAIARLLYILKEIDKDVKVTSSLTDVYNKHYNKVTISITPEFISKRIGVNISKEDIINTLEKLDFIVKDYEKELLVEVPSFRATKDISIKEDLVEEVARSYGYDNIEEMPISMNVEAVEQNTTHLNEYKTKYLLAEKYGMNELHSYLWNYDEFNRKNGIETNTYLSLVDSSIAGQSGIRSQIVPTLVKFMSENKNSFDNINIFEIGRCVTGLDENNLAIEENHLGICIASQNQTSEQLFFRLKEILLDITRNIYNVAVSIGTEKSNIPFVHPVNSTKILSTDKEIGYFGLIHPSVKMSIDKRFNIAVLEVDLNKLATSEEIKNKVKKVSKFQDVNIDYTFLVPKGMKYSEMEMHINEFKAKMVWSCKLTDIFNSKELGDYSAYTFKFNICSLEKTLTANDIDTFNYRILEHMKKIGLNLKN